jgi:hypothetical protein
MNYEVIMNKHCVGFIGAGMISQIAQLPFYLKSKDIFVKAIYEKPLYILV